MEGVLKMGLIILCIILGVLFGILLIALNRIGNHWGKAHMDKWGICDNPGEEHDDKEE